MEFFDAVAVIYPWGSGGPEYNTGNRSFLDHVENLKTQGLSEVEIAKGMGTTVTQLRQAKTIARTEEKQAQIHRAQALRDKGWSKTAIGTEMNLPESTVRGMLAPGALDKLKVLDATAERIRAAVDEKKYVDVGAGTENHMNISSTKLKTALAKLQEEGYHIYYVKEQQVGTGHYTTRKVLVKNKDETPYSEVYRNRDKIQLVESYTEDGGRSYLGITKPLSIDSKRVGINYRENGGAEADGVIYVRPGVPDCSLGHARYAQVRIAVDGTHYIKGMAMYKEDLPKGVDLVFNANKSDTGNKLDALKPMKRTREGDIDPDNPFGSSVRPSVIHPETKEAMTVMNRVYEEGSWDTWSKDLSSQFLSKQTPQFAKTQLDLTYEQKKNDIAEIKQLTNPVVKRHLLEKYADSIDSSAVHLEAAAIPRQATRVILPIKSMKENEIYAPTFNNGERVVLVRHPHGGIFEIPELTVNNKHPEANRLLGANKDRPKPVQDAVGIHPSVAKKLSGADFDGDTVLVIPNNSRKIKTSPMLSGLKDFDPQREYPAYDGMRTIDGGRWNAAKKKVEYPDGPKPRGKGMEMGSVSNLITDMTIKGAPQDEIARAIRHSMVVIDAEKHVLNYKESARVNGITELKERYQKDPNSKGRGAATLISRATSEQRVLERKIGYRIDPATGKKIYRETGNTYTDSKGNVIKKRIKSTKLAETDDAHTLVSVPGTRIERIYADHSNRLKALANEARKEAVNTPPFKYNESAFRAYRKDVDSLNAKLNTALKNAPLERQAQAIANATVSMRKRVNPDMDEKELNKVKFQALTEARTRTGAGKTNVTIEPSEWHAIQAGAVSPSKLTTILKHTKVEDVQKLATPKPSVLMTTTKSNRATAMLASGYTQAEVANALGVSLSTLKRSLGGD